MGMFTDIAEAFPNYHSVMFDYNKILDDGKKTIVPSYRQQAKILYSQIKSITQYDPKADITVIAHSQGCIVSGLVDTQAVSKVVLLAPPWSISHKRAKYRPNRKTLKTGAIKITKRNGDIIILSARFVLALKRVNPIKIYQTLASRAPITTIIAKQDNIVNNDEFEISSSLNPIRINGDHNFTGHDRKGLIATLSKVLS